jgi:hypothetical protein
MGLRFLLQRLQINHNVKTTHQEVMEVMKILDPEGTLLI